MKKVFGVAVVAFALAGCEAPMTPEMQAEQFKRNTPLAEAAIPACVAAAQGRTPDYSGIRALGFTQRDRMIGPGDYFYGSDTNLMGYGTRLLFQSGKGCTASYAYESDDFQTIGRAWVAALERQRYDENNSGRGDFAFTAGGVPMHFNGNHQISQNSNVMNFSIERDR